MVLRLSPDRAASKKRWLISASKSSVMNSSRSSSPEPSWSISSMTRSMSLRLGFMPQKRNALSSSSASTVSSPPARHSKNSSASFKSLNDSDRRSTRFAMYAWSFSQRLRSISRVFFVAASHMAGVNGFTSTSDGAMGVAQKNSPSRPLARSTKDTVRSGSVFGVVDRRFCRMASQMPEDTGRRGKGMVLGVRGQPGAAGRARSSGALLDMLTASCCDVDARRQ
mmetsp:Transcript_32291/g.105792  ORF Transcript_32291/g.105792 Transcript_32291/m.105792 type:complete len:224 (-) Transcript_32291:13-684(-)